MTANDDAAVTRPDQRRRYGSCDHSCAPAGTYERIGRVTGTIRLDDEQWDVNAHGVRDTS